MKTLTSILRERVKGQAYAVAQATGTQYRVTREFVAGKRDPKLSTADKWAAHFGLTLTETKPEKGRRDARPNTRKRKRSDE